MDDKRRQLGMTLTELLVVVAVMALLLGVSVPTIRHLMDSFESSAGTRSLINAALANARAIAIRHQTYAGVRFQEDAEGNTYMIFIIHDPDPSPDGTGLAYGFRAVEGRKPMKLPEDVGVITPYWINRTGFYATAPNYDWDALTLNQLNDASLTDIGTNLVQVAGGMKNLYLMDASTFTIVFSPQGKLIVHRVFVRNKNGRTGASSNDTIFNVASKVEAGEAMFYQDDYGNSPNYGIAPEMSVQSFKIYGKKQYTQTSNRWSDYLEFIDLDYISPYTGEIVMEYHDD